MYILNKLLNPGIYQGRFRHGRYFEGWYFKLIDRESRNIFAIIPGVAMGAKGSDAHAFIQVSDAVRGKAYYVRYPFSEFSSEDRKFGIKIAQSRFTSEGIHADIKNDKLEVKGDLLFTGAVPFPRTLLNPGIMGPFSFLPFMECYNDILSIHHEIKGGLAVNGQPVGFTGGYGYIEKDWGRSFPETWVWIQSNHFDSKDASIMFSIAKIPMPGTHFTGFLAFLRLGERFYRFATYNGAKVTSLSIGKDSVEASLEGKDHNLCIATRNKGGNTIKAPKNGIMATDINESITSEVTVLLSDRQGKTIFTGLGHNTGLEIAGDISVLKSSAGLRN